MTPFSLRTPDRILFGRDARLQAADAIADFGRKVALVRGGAVPWVDTLRQDLTDAGAEVLELRSAGEPSLPQLDAALARARPFEPDVVVAVGGGATVDLGKAIAGLIRSPLPPIAHFEVVGAGHPIDGPVCPFVAIPTTSGTGAEATKNAVITVPERAIKVSLRDDRMLAALALVDPALTDGCPKALTLASGLDAVTQLIEPYVSCRANPVTDSLCRDMIPQALAALARLMQTEDPDARDTLSRASLLSGIVLANSGLGIVHGLAGVIGGRTGAPHGALCGRLLPASLTVNHAALRDAGQSTARIDEVWGWIGEALGQDRANRREALESFLAANGLTTLEAMGCTAADHAAIAAQAAKASSTKANPVVLTEAQIAGILAQTP
ncbi:iron-containing alcohol dehydrogenase [Aestuariicoccus sp. MJ-SS9]|uniref:iron-containing alcohol dehydrogenase n=1 Tax=Aestuariicoccus sp. MJ-SS9 TaxID=3079855 RepID=UPI002907AA56|nr:iron-containing alcohol dehydrogenase [Aestuariicoccus sp. MJ-SS9]MDU8910037.1 iron-containing alcohol dehydrogenase [Aestuariicoccus sp. MJ-SS9]